MQSTKAERRGTVAALALVLAGSSVLLGCVAPTGSAPPQNVTTTPARGRTVLHGASIATSNRPVSRRRTRALTVGSRGQQIALSVVVGEDMLLNGEIDDPAPGGGIRCCLSTADQQGCDSLLAEACAALGGTTSGGGACKPDTCPQQGDDDGGAADETDDDAQSGNTD
jgi:hypothetical protein